MIFRLIVLCGFLLACLSGCASLKTTDTSRTGMEQLLISKAVDESLNQIDFRPFAGSSVYLDTQYLDCVDKGYVVSAARHRLLQAGAELADSADSAQVVAEIRSGGVGTDRSETFVGIPEIAVPAPLPVAIPEVRLWSRQRQFGTAKLGVVAYEPASGRILGSGGTTLARADDTNTYVLGIGPLQSGKVRRDVSNISRRQSGLPALPTSVAFASPPRATSPSAGETEGGPLRLASSEEEGQADSASASDPNTIRSLPSGSAPLSSPSGNSEEFWP